VKSSFGSWPRQTRVQVRDLPGPATRHHDDDEVEAELVETLDVLTDPVEDLGKAESVLGHRAVDECVSFFPPTSI
jgi:hypothetical protein